MTRTRRTARQAGTRFERTIADHLAQTLNDDRIDRRPKTGNHDRGDIANVRTHDGQRIVIECKDVTKMALPEWTAEAHHEANNDHALVGVVVSKRHGVADPTAQWVHMTLNDLIALLTGHQPDTNHQPMTTPATTPPTTALHTHHQQ